MIWSTILRNKIIAHSHIVSIIMIFQSISLEIYKAMRNILLAGVLIAGVFIVVGCENQSGMQRFSGDEALELVSIQIDFGYRIPGSDAHRQAGKWIKAELESRGWMTAVQEFNYKDVTLINVIGKSDGRTVPGPILIGAHYDTRPQADRDSYNPSLPVPGANDGASGVAVLLELASVLEFEQLQKPVWLVFFDGEDSGKIDGWDWIVGSTYFVDHLTSTPEVVVIVDMVGDEELQLYYERNSDDNLARQIWEIAEDLGYRSFIPSERYSIIDDHTPFLHAGIPAIDIIDFDYPYWHTTEDTMERISASSLEQVGRTLQLWLETTAMQD